MIVVDTNTLSELSKRLPNSNVVGWFSKRQRNELVLCSPVLAELVFGAEKFRSRTGDSRHFVSLDNLRRDLLSPLVLTFDARAAHEFGLQRAKREIVGLPILEFDLMIAAICIVNDATLATRNVRDFDGLDLKLVNPFEAGA